ncbi:MAG TPA: trimethylamine methyltransferase family protein, partial [Anaerolineales bacterium]|nr:trimethylamine methyltransferase family protein [Anaerolineales bacterium]
VGYEGNYLQEDHTAENFRKELFIPSLYSREPFEAWQKAGEPMAMDHAREKVKKVLAEHEPYEVDPEIEKDLDMFRQSVAARSLEDFYLFEQEEKQDYENL